MPMSARRCRSSRARSTTARLCLRSFSRSDDRTLATSSQDEMRSAAATSTVAATVMRSRTVPQVRCLRGDITLDGGRRCVGDEPVAGAAYRQDRLDAERRIDLLAHIADVRLDDVRVALEVGTPDLVEQHRL